MNSRISGVYRLFGLVIILAAGPLFGASPNRTENVVLVTADGLRWQEVFGGIDKSLMHAEKAGMKNARRLREKLWHDSAAERRKRLLPFFWGELARQGVVLGNRNAGSTVRLGNSIRVSYPGYSEILTGRVRDDVIRGNDEIQNPSPTVLEVFREQCEAQAVPDMGMSEEDPVEGAPRRRMFAERRARDQVHLPNQIGRGVNQVVTLGLGFDQSD